MALTTNAATTNPPLDLQQMIKAIGQLGLWLQALGIIVIAWIIFHLVMYYINRKRLQKLEDVIKDVDRIEKKIDKLIQQTKKR